jgi:hypothetical protein
MTRHRLIWSVLALAALLLAACDGDDGSPTATESPTATPTSTETITATATESAQPSPTATATATATPSPTSTAVPDFEETGTLVRDNPGLPSGVWFLLYEEPGAPALTVELSFDESSQCTRDAQRVACDTLEVGTRAHVTGTRGDTDVVVVAQLEIDPAS